MASCGAARATVRRAPAGRARSLSAPIRRRAVSCRAVGLPDIQSNLPGVEAFRKQLSDSQPSTGGSASQSIDQLQSTLTDLAYSAVARSKGIYNEANAAVSDKLVPSVKQLSSQLTEQLSGASGAASSASADLLSRSSEIGLQAGDKLSALSERLSSSVDPAKYAGQFNDLSDKVLSLTSELSSKSSDVSTQFATALQQQLASAPEFRERFAAGADAFVRNINSTSNQASGVFSTELTGVTDKFEESLDMLESLLSSGQFTEALATPEGIGAVTVAALGLAVAGGAMKGSSSTPSPNSTATQTAMAASASQKPVSDAVSARAWIDQWRSSQNGSKGSSPSVNGASPAAPETPQQWPTGESSGPSNVHNGVTAGASLNGASSNGAAPPSGTFSGALNTYDSGADGALVDQSEVQGTQDSPLTETPPTNGASPSAEASQNGATPPAEADSPALYAAQETPAPAPVLEGEWPADAPAAAAAADTADQDQGQGQDDKTANGVVEQQQEGAAADTAEAPPKEHVISLRYYSGWEAPTIHACAAGGEWTAAEMGRDETGALTWQATVAEGAQMEGGGVAEFVITDGAGDWDKAPTGENYKLPSVGVFALQDGTLTLVAEEAVDGPLGEAVEEEALV